LNASKAGFYRPDSNQVGTIGRCSAALPRVAIAAGALGEGADIVEQRLQSAHASYNCSWPILRLREGLHSIGAGERPPIRAR
jgi:hypothetical protein